MGRVGVVGSRLGMGAFFAILDRPGRVGGRGVARPSNVATIGRVAAEQRCS